MCGCFGNMCTCIYCFVLFLYCFVYVYLFLFVLSVLLEGLLPPSDNSIAINNNNNINTLWDLSGCIPFFAQNAIG